MTETIQEIIDRYYIQQRQYPTYTSTVDYENQKFKIVSGLRSCIIIERLIAVPLYLYISLMNLKTFTTLYVVSTVVELLSLFVSGKKLDKDQIKTFNVISVIKGIITSVFLFAKNTYILMVNQSIYKLVDNVYDSSY